MMRLVAVLAGALVLSGCATTPKFYSRPGSTNDDFQRELAGCRNKLAMVPEPATNPNANGLEALGAGLGALANREQFMQDCLRSQGWTPQDAHRQ